MKLTSVVGFVIIGIILGVSTFYFVVIFNTKIIDFINSNSFNTLAILFVGSFAIVLYLVQKVNYKRGIAGSICQEIRYAEEQIRTARILEANYYLANKLLPTNTWNKNVHLFVGDLEEAEIDAISRFYSHAKYLDSIIRKISDSKSLTIDPGIQFMSVCLKFFHQYQELQTELTRVGLMQQIQTSQPQSLKFIQNLNITINRIKQLAEIPNLGAITILKDVSKKTEFIYNTPSIEKVRIISEKKWYHFL